MSLWACDTYTIEKLETKTETWTKIVGNADYEGWLHDVENGAGISPAEHGQDPTPNTFDLEMTYYVTVQRLPTSSYPETTDVLVRRLDNFDKLPVGIGSADLLSNLSSFVNTAISAYDAEFNGSAIETPDKTDFVTILPT